jgi:hypothetical protein
VSVAVLSRNSLLAVTTPSRAATSSANPVLARLSRSPPAVAINTSDGMAMPFPVPEVAASSRRCPWLSVDSRRYTSSGTDI